MDPKLKNSQVKIEKAFIQEGETAEDSFIPSYATALLGLLGGAVFLSLADRFESSVKMTSEGESMSRIKMMVFAITLHNIPEGLAIGVAFGAITNGDRGELIAAAMLAFGIGIQNIPEGAAVSLPLLKEGKSPWYSFLYGTLSGCVEPISGVIGAALVILIRPILPFALSFAAGAMLYVVVGELIPDATENGATSRKKCVWGTVIGFGIMMALDVALG